MHGRNICCGLPRPWPAAGPELSLGEWSAQRRGWGLAFSKTAAMFASISGWCDKERVGLAGLMVQLQSECHAAHVLCIAVETHTRANQYSLPPSISPAAAPGPPCQREWRPAGGGCGQCLQCGALHSVQRVSSQARRPVWVCEGGQGGEEERTGHAGSKQAIHASQTAKQYPHAPLTPGVSLTCAFQSLTDTQPPQRLSSPQACPPKRADVLRPRYHGRWGRACAGGLPLGTGTWLCSFPAGASQRSWYWQLRIILPLVARAAGKPGCSGACAGRCPQHCPGAAANSPRHRSGAAASGCRRKP